MHNKKTLFIAFIIVALIQLYIPAKMIWDREDIIRSGTEYKFRTAPIDPNDPFRGKYIGLSYSDNSIVVPRGQQWIPGESVYVSLKTDNNGFAKIKSVTRERPSADQDFIKTKISFITENGSHKLTLDFPFDRLYMEESKAYDAELTYLRSQQDTSTITYALVNIKNGEAVLKDVMIDRISIRDMVKSNQKGI